MKKVKYLLISDLHLGSGMCRARELLVLLQSYEYEYLIIVGDLHERWLDKSPTDDEFKLVTYLRYHRHKIIYIDGNHDRSEGEFVARFIGVKIVKEYCFEVAGKRFCSIHGDQFHKVLFIFDESVVDHFFSAVISFIKRMKNFSSERLVQWIENSHYSFSLQIAKKAVRYGWKPRISADVIVCGHTHKAMRKVFFHKKSGKMCLYLNTGCWVDDKCSYVTVDWYGNAELHFVDASC